MHGIITACKPTANHCRELKKKLRLGFAHLKSIYDIQRQVKPGLVQCELGHRGIKTRLVSRTVCDTIVPLQWLILDVY